MANKTALEAKKKVVSEISELLGASKIGVLVDYSGITVEQDTALRTKFREAGVQYKVYPNRLVKFAIDGGELSSLEPILHGPTALATSDSDLIAPAKIINDFAKDNEQLEIKGGFMEGKVIDIATVKQLASLPPKEVLVAKLLGSMQSPLYGLANVLNANISGLARALNAVAGQKSA